MLTVEMSATIHRKSLSEMEKQKGKYKLPGCLSIHEAGVWVTVDSGLVGSRPVHLRHLALSVHRTPHSYYHNTSSRDKFCRASGDKNLHIRKFQIQSRQDSRPPQRAEICDRARPFRIVSFVLGLNKHLFTRKTDFLLLVTQPSTEMH